MKRFIALLLIAVMCFCLTACNSYWDRYDQLDDARFEEYGFIKIKQLGRYGENACYLVYDPITKVEYIACTGSYGNFSVCPYYDEYGNVAIYGGD